MRQDSYFGRKEGEKNKRLLMIGSEIKAFITELLQNEKIKHIDLNNQSISITKVDVSRDLSNARVYIIINYVNNIDDNSEKILQALKESSSFIKKLLGKSSSLSRIPNINFLKDNTLIEVSNINNILDNLQYKNND